MLAGPAASVFVLTNGIGTALAGPAGIAADAGVKKAGILVTDVPVGVRAGQAGGTDLLQERRVSRADVIVVPVGQADMTPQIQAGISAGDGAFAMVGNPPFCTSAIKGLTTVGFKGPVTAIQQCVDQTSAKATNGGYKGVNVLTTLNSANKEYRSTSRS